jgi:hypothetical protein
VHRFEESFDVTYRGSSNSSRWVNHLEIFLNCGRAATRHGGKAYL